MYLRFGTVNPKVYLANVTLSIVLWNYCEYILYS